VIIHCRTESEANHILNAVKNRLEACNLKIHEGKTKIVYCQDYKRKKKQYRKKFDFLGFSFQPRSMKSKRNSGGWFLGYDCAISTAAKKKIMAEIRAMKIQRWTSKTIEELAEMLNPKLGGWAN